LDYFPNPLVSAEQLRRARAEAGVLDEMFGRYKREAECEVGPGVGKTGRGRRCGECGEWCCNVSCGFFFGLFGWGGIEGGGLIQRLVVVAIGGCV
jgi:hypothetical protein